jgi:hypothetical protein
MAALPARSLLLPCLLVALGVPGPARAAGAYTVGGGPNLSFVDREEAPGETFSVRFGFNAGVGYERPFSRYFSLIPEANLETRGVVSEAYSAGLGADTKTTLKLLYLQVPVLAVAKLPLGPAALNAYIGPSLGLRLSSEAELRGAGQTTTRDLDDETRLFNFGIEWGIGVEFPARRGRVFIRPGYYIGQTEVYEEGEGPEMKFVDIRLKMGYRFPL